MAPLRMASLNGDVSSYNVTISRYLIMLNLVKINFTLDKVNPFKMFFNDRSK